MKSQGQAHLLGDCPKGIIEPVEVTLPGKNRNLRGPDIPSLDVAIEFVDGVLNAFLFHREQRGADQTSRGVGAELAQPVIEGLKARQPQFTILDVIDAGRDAYIKNRGIAAVGSHVLEMLP